MEGCIASGYFVFMESMAWTFHILEHVRYWKGFSGKIFEQKVKRDMEAFTCM